MIQTAWEQTGEWTLRSEMESFLTTVAAETSMELSSAGSSVAGNPIWRCDFGNPLGPTFMVVGGQHANEMAGREGCLAWLRDLAYSTDPQILTYLESHHVVVLPALNPDTMDPPRRRTNAVGVDLNGTWLSLSQPETRAGRAVWLETGAALVADCHERDTPTYDLAYRAAGRPPAHPDLVAHTAGINSAIVDGVSAGGYTVGLYPQSAVAGPNLRTSSAAFHAIGVLAETAFAYERADRVDVHKRFLNALLGYHRVNAGSLESARAASILDATTSTAPIPITVSNSENAGPGSIVEIPDPGFYDISDIAVPAGLLERHGVVVAAGGLVSTQQPARRVIASLLDPRSRSYVGRDPVGFDAWGVRPQFQVMYGGVLRRVTGLFVQEGASRRNVLDAFVQEGVSRHRVRGR